ncbi:hypothetical protein CDG76_16625 [Nostoc sp. 'Peltigera membranacea cyanobiont' 210A]|nr:hypothetical protein CDG76_16625 [Nostoc sp. 'Peltigera membranacea cyanobiont' 210A]
MRFGWKIVLSGLKHFGGRNKPQTHVEQGKYTKYSKTAQTQIYQETKRKDVKDFLYIGLKLFFGYFLSKSHYHYCFPLKALMPLAISK